MNVLNSFKLDGRVIIITGGAGLLGREYSRTVSEAGGISIAADINADRKQEYVDITDKDSIDALVKRVLTKYGRIDGLVNNAGLDPKFDSNNVKRGIPRGAFEDYPLEAWNAAMNVNLTGMFLMTQACIKPMLAKGKKGSVVNICSTYGLNGPDQRVYKKRGKRVAFKPVDYSVTKAGVLGFTKYLAAYYAGTKIRVNSLTPGGVFNHHDKTFMKNYSTKTILGRMARRDEMNGALLFLISDASSYMTGANLVVDGGWTAW